MTEAAEAFIAQARSLLSADYLPKIEQRLERLSDEEVCGARMMNRTALATW